MTLMYDSTNPLDIPVDAPAVAGYMDGLYQWSDSAWSRFRTQLRLDITVLGNAADVLDVETGDATPDQAVEWVRSMRAHDYPYPGVYCNSNLWPTVKATFDAHRVDQPWYWIADYDGRPDIPDGAVAKQYQNAPGSGGHFDLSVISDELITYITSGGKRMISQDDANLIATTLLNWRITTTTKPTGSSGRQVWDVLGDGERIRADLLADTTLVEDLVKALPAGGSVDPTALAADLAAPLASLLAPAITAAETTPTEFFTALAAQLAK
jgi:hypothetical protein